MHAKTGRHEVSHSYGRVNAFLPSEIHPSVYSGPERAVGRLFQGRRRRVWPMAWRLIAHLRQVVVIEITQRYQHDKPATCSNGRLHTSCRSVNPPNRPVSSVDTARCPSARRWDGESRNSGIPTPRVFLFSGISAFRLHFLISPILALFGVAD